MVEWLAAHSPVWLVHALRTFVGRPRPDVRLLEVRPTGGSSGRVDFALFLQNYWDQPCRINVSARVGVHSVQVSPDGTIDLLVNQATTMLNAWHFGGIFNPKRA